MRQEFDILVVGGGINGAAIARDATGRGARVMLVEKDDLAAHTSSASTKLIHGGLRYLEQYEFRLVAESLAERERLARAAPHLIRGLRFVLPHDRSMRPKWMMRVGLFLYDRLGGRSSLPRSGGASLRGTLLGAPLKPDYDYGFLYSDCWGDDSRLVVTNARDAADHGAVIATRTRLVRADRHADHWAATLATVDGEQQIVARALVNATGSWAADFLPDLASLKGVGSLRLIKGSHIVTRRLFGGDHAYMLQNPDRRIIFAIPYEQDFTLIGTTDVAWDGPVGNVKADPAEVAYLCDSVSRWFASPITPADVIASFAGLRPLYDDDSANPSEISRDYVLALDDSVGAPVLSVFGGKLTTHRALAERAVDKLSSVFPSLRTAWTADATFPGGDFAVDALEILVAQTQSRAPFLDARTVRRLVESYGTRVDRILGDATSLDDLGEQFGEGLTAAEVDHLVREEWACTAEDILWRRSKLGLRMPPGAVARLTAYLDGQTAKTMYA